MASVQAVKERVVGLLTRNGKNGVDHQVPATTYKLLEGIMTTHKLETVCPRCNQSGEIDNIIGRGVSGEEFTPGTRILKHESERPPEVVIGQICRAWVAVSDTEDEICGHRLWSGPVAPRRANRRTRPS